MSAHFAISPQLDDVVIKERLLTKTTVTRGEPPVKKLIKRFTVFAAEAERGADLDDCEKAYRALLQELATFQLPLAKAQAVIDANRREQTSFSALQQELDAQIAEAQAEIEQLKVQLEEARAERKHQEECEAIRRLIAAQTPRSLSEAAISTLRRQLAALESENLAATRTLDLRKKQFLLLMHAIEELQNAMEDEDKPGPSMPADEDMDAPPHGVAPDAPDVVTSVRDPMAIDPA